MKKGYCFIFQKSICQSDLPNENYMYSLNAAIKMQAVLVDCVDNFQNDIIIGIKTCI